MTSERKTKSTKRKSEQKVNIKKKKEQKKEVDNVNAKILNRIIGNSTKENENRNVELVDLQTLFSQRQDRLWKALEERYQYNSSVKRGQEFLLNHVNSKVELVIMYIDLVGSTKMSMTLPVEQLVTIIRAFTHEISSVVESYNGYVLKYVGDAIISFFPCGFNKYLISDKSVQCAKSMINVIKNGINPILTKHDYPELSVKIGIDEGEDVVVQYGYDKSSLIDILGYSMNVAAKITSLTAANKISVGNVVYKLLHPTIQSKFELLSIDQGWKYVDRETGELYKVFTMK
ncbi:MAG: adenylate/guanylate cyclase domain-containing protein [Nitrososphaeraceae archaeon]|nr:adenylate/guanylate cyclase domain-containing protein [Nitrososphaeraceae archaeon]MDW3612513.1 adenylate/guanylate cyclase domain-containing protein [Nitrososphaeraceae archaeon]MDW3626089.1 adenylate/guanylate cyclase domain-containing protein [Nitrososphaeraceae archaeon]MDW3630157.1 adenylate/guanylate cyclase domain-containing protein [Nitrososphaeraceae archaeon]